MERILVVDDEKPVRETLGLLLRQEGYRVVVAEYLDDLLHAVYLSPPADADWSRGSDKPPHQRVIDCGG